MLGKIVFVNGPKEHEIGIVVNEHLGSTGIECLSLQGGYSFFVLLRDIFDVTKTEIYATRSHAVICWYRDPEECYQPSEGNVHRDGDLPAIIWLDGTKEWWQNGYRHRGGDKPAVIRFDGTKDWYRHGLLHRLDGPARITDTHQEFWENGKMLKRYPL